MVGRPKRFDESEALRAAMLVFWRRGYEAASCDELLAAMGINCGSMYSTFGDKRALFEKAFDLYHAEVFSKMASVINGTGTPIENVRALVKCWEKGISESECRGCLISHTLIEFGDSDDPIVERAKNLLDQVRSAIEKQLRAAKRCGELRSGPTPKDLSAMLINTAQGMTVMARAGAEKDVFRGVIRSTLAMLA